jgi:hypothetical protein
MVVVTGQCYSKQCNKQKRSFEADPSKFKELVSPKGVSKNTYQCSGTCPECKGNISTIISKKNVPKAAPEEPK